MHMNFLLRLKYIRSIRNDKKLLKHQFWICYVFWPFQFLLKQEILNQAIYESKAAGTCSLSKELQFKQLAQYSLSHEP